MSEFLSAGPYCIADTPKYIINITVVRSINSTCCDELVRRISTHYANEWVELNFVPVASTEEVSRSSIPNNTYVVSSIASNIK